VGREAKRALRASQSRASFGALIPATWQALAQPSLVTVAAVALALDDPQVTFSIRTVLLASFAGIGVVVIGQAGFAVHRLGTMFDAIDGIYDDSCRACFAAPM
jgi:hypothetical protein